MKEIESRADRASVRAKINSLRTAYRRELKKMKDSKKSGGGTDDVYLPNLWYFDKIDFLRDQETQMQGASTMDETEFIEKKDETDDTMLLKTLITLTTFLLELCNSSPIYNMQPAFITNTIGTSSGRNIRKLPCLSKKSNRKGVCMFAIDCLKANGTHLGTCIDRFYFGSCCHIELVHNILDNTIESDIIPQREPPLRISNTTNKPTPSTTIQSISSTYVDKIHDSHNSNNASTTTISNHSNGISSSGTNNNSNLSSSSNSSLVEESTKATTTKISNTAIFGERIKNTTVIPTTPSTAITTLQSLQTFQSVNGIHMIETTTNTIKSTITSTVLPKVTNKPVASNYSKPVTLKPASIRPSIKTTVKPKPGKPSSVILKPEKTTKAPLNVTQKPHENLAKPIRVTFKTTTRKPQVTSTKFSPVIKVTKKPGDLSKPTKRITTTTQSTYETEQSTQKILLTTTEHETITTTESFTPYTISSTTSHSISTDKTSEMQNITISTTSTLPALTTTTVSNNVPIIKLNASEVLETANGNTATNEIEATNTVVHPIPSKPTLKPGVATWAIGDDKNYTTSPVDNDVFSNVTTEDWVPITTPDGWVLLPSVPSNQSQEITLVPIITSTMSTDKSPTSAASTASTILPLLTTSSMNTVGITESTTASTVPLVSTSNSDILSTPITVKPTDVRNSTPTTEIIVSSSETLPTELIDRPVNMSDYTDACGRRMYPEARIVGGDKAAFGEWPWQISLRQWRTSTYLHKCGAALLNENWAITAAHCVDTVPPSDLLLRLGEHDLSTEEEPYLHQERRVQIVASHPQFDPRTFEYDLALLRFYEPVTFQPNILPVCVPQSDENFVGRTAYVTGWGRLYEDGPLPSIVQKVSVPVINNTVCEQMYRSAGYIEHIPHIFICAGWRRGGFDSCEGDSGGPMVIQRPDRRFLLAGVISWGIGCAEPNQPGVYTRISEFRDWINQILQF